MSVGILSSKSEPNSANLTLVSVVSMGFGPTAVVVIKGKLENQMDFLCDHGKERDRLKERTHRNSDIPNIGLKSEMTASSLLSQQSL